MKRKQVDRAVAFFPSLASGQTLESIHEAGGDDGSWRLSGTELPEGDLVLSYNVGDRRAQLDGEKRRNFWRGISHFEDPNLLSLKPIARFTDPQTLWTFEAYGPRPPAPPRSSVEMTAVLRSATKRQREQIMTEERRRVATYSILEKLVRNVAMHHGGIETKETVPLASYLVARPLAQLLDENSPPEDSHRVALERGLVASCIKLRDVVPEDQVLEPFIDIKYAEPPWELPEPRQWVGSDPEVGSEELTYVLTLMLFSEGYRAGGANFISVRNFWSGGKPAASLEGAPLYEVCPTTLECFTKDLDIAIKNPDHESNEGLPMVVFTWALPGGNRIEIWLADEVKEMHCCPFLPDPDIQGLAEPIRRCDKKSLRGDGILDLLCRSAYTQEEQLRVATRMCHEDSIVVTIVDPMRTNYLSRLDVVIEVAVISAGIQPDELLPPARKIARQRIEDERLQEKVRNAEKIGFKGEELRLDAEERVFYADELGTSDCRAAPVIKGLDGYDSGPRGPPISAMDRAVLAADIRFSGIIVEWLETLFEGQSLLLDVFSALCGATQEYIWPLRYVVMRRFVPTVGNLDWLSGPPAHNPKYHPIPTAMAAEFGASCLDPDTDRSLATWCFFMPIDGGEGAIDWGPMGLFRPGDLLMMVDRPILLLDIEYERCAEDPFVVNFVISFVDLLSGEEANLTSDSDMMLEVLETIPVDWWMARLKVGKFTILHDMKGPRNTDVAEAALLVIRNIRALQRTSKGDLTEEAATDLVTKPVRDFVCLTVKDPKLLAAALASLRSVRIWAYLRSTIVHLVPIPCGAENCEFLTEERPLPDCLLAGDLVNGAPAFMNDFPGIQSAMEKEQRSFFCRCDEDRPAPSVFHASAVLARFDLPSAMEDDETDNEDIAPPEAPPGHFMDSAVDDLVLA